MADLLADLFSTPPRAARLAQLCQLCTSVYADSLDTWKGPDFAAPQKLWGGPPQVWALTIDGVKVCCCEGTTLFPTQYTGQAGGWIEPATWPGGGGVNAYVQGVADAIFPALPNDIQVFVGHSFGGSLATILASKFLAAGLSVSGVLTFGAPKCFTADAVTGSGPFAPQINIQAPGDVVPMIPPDGTGGAVWGLPGNIWTMNPGIAIVPAVPPVSSPGSIYLAIATGGIDDHATTNYLDLLSGIPGDPVVIPPAEKGTTVPNAWFTVRIQGVLAGQSVQNVLHYSSEGNTTPSANSFALAVQSHWRANVLPLVSSAYSVLTYTAALIEGAPLRDPTAIPLRNRWAYSDAAAVAGNNSDVGGKSGNAAPSLVAFGFTKICGSWYSAGDNAQVPLGGIGRGSIRIAGVLEGDTIDGDPDQVNKITAGRLLELQTLCLTLLDIVDDRNGVLAELGVLRKEDGLGPIQKPAGTGSFQWSPVRSMTLNPYVTSQVSRKQSIRRLG